MSYEVGLQKPHIGYKIVKIKRFPNFQCSYLQLFLKIAETFLKVTWTTFVVTCPFSKRAALDIDRACKNYC